MTFSIKSLFALVTLICVAVYALVAAPQGLAVPLLFVLNTLLTGALLGRIVYGTGTLRAFAIGAMVPIAGMMAAQSWILLLLLDRGILDFDQLAVRLEGMALAMRVFSGAAWLLCPLLGVVTATARRALLAHPSDNTPPHAGASSPSNQQR